VSKKMSQKMYDLTFFDILVQLFAGVMTLDMVSGVCDRCLIRSL